eukprot:8527294-Heterocapsa_arctica.AAC.1
MAIISMLFQQVLGDREGPPGPNGDHHHAVHLRDREGQPGPNGDHQHALAGGPRRSQRAAWP